MFRDDLNSKSAQIHVSTEPYTTHASYSLPANHSHGWCGPALHAKNTHCFLTPLQTCFLRPSKSSFCSFKATPLSESSISDLSHFTIKETSRPKGEMIVSHQTPAISSNKPTEVPQLCLTHPHYSQGQRSWVIWTLVEFRRVRNLELSIQKSVSKIQFCSAFFDKAKWKGSKPISAKRHRLFLFVWNWYTLWQHSIADWITRASDFSQA